MIATSPPPDTIELEGHLLYHYAPPARPDALGGVLLLPPFGEERKGVLRLLHHLGQTLSQAGIAGTILEFAGTGDAAGDFSQLSWAELLSGENLALARQQPSLILAVRNAARLVLEGAGATLPAIFWDPIVDLATWHRETTRRSAFRHGDTPRPENDVDGFLYSSDLREAMATRSGIPGRGRGPRALIASAPGGRLPGLLRALGESWGLPVTPIDLSPYWLETDPVDGAELIAITMGELEHLAPFSATDLESRR